MAEAKGSGSPALELNKVEKLALLWHTVRQSIAVAVVGLCTWLLPLVIPTIPQESVWGVIAVGVLSTVLKLGSLLRNNTSKKVGPT